MARPNPSIAVLHGPNLNLLGEREPDIYGTATLEDLDRDLGELAEQLGFTLSCFQSNHEGELIDRLQEQGKQAAGVILNPAGLTHTSIVLRDAVAACPVPVIEVHLSNIYRREYFRHHSYISPVAAGIITGFGFRGYSMALCALAETLPPTRNDKNALAH